MSELKTDEPVYIISIAARLVGMHPQTLRMYERKGLICPARIGHMRLYSSGDIQRLRVIQEYTRRRRINLAGVELALELLQEIDELRREMEQRLLASGRARAIGKKSRG
jgi:MerR family transcriptional regulator, heat shock protein HspR